MATEDIRVRMGLDKSGLDAGLKGAMSSVSNFASKFGIAIGGLSLLSGAKSLLEMADNFDRLAKTAGVSVETFQRISNGFVGIGLDASTTEGAIRKFSKAMAEAQLGDGPGAGAFKTLGLSAFDASGKAKTFEQSILDVSDAMAKMDNEQQALLVGMELFGKNGVEIVSALKDGSAAMKEAMADAIVLTKEEAKQMADANATLDRWWNKVKLISAKSLNSALGSLFSFGSNNDMANLLSGNLSDSFAQAQSDKYIQDQLDAAKELKDLQAGKLKLLKEQEAVEDRIRKDTEAEEDSNKRSLQHARDKLAAKIEDVNLKIQNNQEDREKSLQDRSGWSVDELAAMQGSRTKAGWGFIQKARKVKELERMSRQNRLEGFPELADLNQKRALDIRGELQPLTGGERDPLPILTGLRDDMKALRELAQGTGLKVITRMNQ